VGRRAEQALTVLRPFLGASGVQTFAAPAFFASPLPSAGSWGCPTQPPAHPPAAGADLGRLCSGAAAWQLAAPPAWVAAFAAAAAAKAAAWDAESALEVLGVVRSWWAAGGDGGAEGAAAAGADEATVFVPFAQAAAQQVGSACA